MMKALMRCGFLTKTANDTKRQSNMKSKGNSRILRSLIAVLVSSLIFSSVAQARAWQVDFILAKGDRAIPRQAAILMGQFVTLKFAEIGLQVKIRRVSFTKLTNPQYSTLDYGNGVYWWQRHLPPRKNILRHVITPPILEDGVYYIAGVAPGFCLVRWVYAVSTSNAQMINIKGIDRFWQSALAILHELAHLFGAKHVESHTIMNTGSLAFDDVKLLKFAPESVHQIYNCIGG